jgi:dATP/dGTP diphosphohydrolase
MDENEKATRSNEKATRNEVPYRFDILDWFFIKEMAVLAFIGAKKYGDFNWKKSRLTGNSSPVNHMASHLSSYIQREEYDNPTLGSDPKNHLLAIAFNAMMEYWYCVYDENLE